MSETNRNQTGHGADIFSMMCLKYCYHGNNHLYLLHFVSPYKLVCTKMWEKPTYLWMPGICTFCPCRKTRINQEQQELLWGKVFSLSLIQTAKAAPFEMSSIGEGTQTSSYQWISHFFVPSACYFPFQFLSEPFPFSIEGNQQYGVLY